MRRARRDYVVGALQAIPGVECFSPDGAFYVLPKVSALYGKSAKIDGKSYTINDCEDLVMFLLGMKKRLRAVFLNIVYSSIQRANVWRAFQRQHP